MYSVLTVAYSLLMIAGTVEFAGRRLSRIWPLAGVIAFIAASAGYWMHIPFTYYILPGIAFTGTTYIAIGRIFWKINVPGLGKYVTAGAFMMLGLHHFDMPILFPLPWFTPWGFLLDGLLKFAIAIGIILVYFEKVRYDLDVQGKYFRLMTENAMDVIYRYRMDKSAGFEYVSPAVKEFTGYDPDYFRTIRQVIHVVHPDDRAKFKVFLRGATEFDVLTAFRIIHKNGDILWAEQKHSKITDTDCRPVAVEGIVRNVTKRMRLEQDMARLDRLNVAGQMAANLAHEVRNPLTTIRGYLQLLGNKSEFAHYKDQLGMLLEELDRTNHIITEYLALSKDKMVDMKQCSLNAIIQSIYPLLQTDAIASNIEVQVRLEEIPELYLDDKEIKQLVLNLCRNAVEAMPEGGRLEIMTRAMDEATVLSIKDQGKGISQQVLNNLGKPFFTTKESGTGLGMAICYRIAGRHHAKLDIETGPAGTTVSVIFQNSWS
ncbi:MAG: ATP-binding protein [Negativicutes bacterium]|nr:ATP-binding protein [Negativicutes bacterium]